MKAQKIDIFIGLAALLFLFAQAQVIQAQSRDGYISTLYAGPNAFPVPEMLDGRVSPDLRVEVAADYHAGFLKDRTANLFARVYIPLFTRRVNLTVWMPVVEWYSMTAERMQQCRLEQQAPMQGYGFGDVYVSTDMQLLVENKYRPDIALRAAVKTASGEQWDRARYFDNPGYFFDLAVGKSMYVGSGGTVSAVRQSEADWELRLAGSVGFLCWQTITARQDDAYQYGLQLLARQQWVSLRLSWTGYSGWMKNGDKPMVLKAQLRGHTGGLEPFIDYQYGLRDYPFHSLRIGFAYNIDIISMSKRKAAKEK